MLMLIQPAQAKTVDKTIIDDKFVCMDATTKFEKKYEIKEHLLSTISNVESGKWDENLNRRTTWPWTINAQGKGMHFKTKEEAIAKVRKLQAEGIKSIDVGCMQINLSYHGDAFESLEDAFDPYKNVEYGAQFLKNLYSKTDDDWMKAATNYHSKKPVKAQRYKKKIVAAYEEVKLSLNSDIFEDVAQEPTIKAKKLKAPKVKIAAAKKTNLKDSVIKKLSTKNSDTSFSKEDKANKANEWREAKLEQYRKEKIK